LQYYIRNPNVGVPDTNELPSLATYVPPSAPAPPIPSYPSPAAPGEGRTEVALSRSGGGTFHVLVTINSAIRLPFIIDSGASDVTIPDDVMLTPMRTGTITEGDFLGKRNYKLADGSTTLSTTFRIRSLRVGDTLWCMNRREAEPIVLGVPHDSDVQRWRANKVLQRRHDRRVDGALPVGLDDPCRTNSTRAAATRYRWPGIA
jgi:hypothetical protein